MIYDNYQVSTCQGAVRAWCCFLGDPVADWANSLFRGGSIGTIGKIDESSEEQAAPARSHKARAKSCNMLLFSSSPETLISRRRIERTHINSCMHVSLPSISLITFIFGLGATAAPLRLCQPTSSAPLTRGESKIQPSATRFLPACLLCCARFVRRADNKLLVCFRSG